ncbi:hypothetical protein Acr_24g0008950 [Actinidia rufa]|uniref:Uncharacterized protein n=1 Tax=Actinidia rufa TaxID=165716 RepID=A0A7J0GV24_9ERIC|nr:hypothetical protein Acr_24g0008950 [Actinidia rufa]
MGPAAIASKMTIFNKDPALHNQERGKDVSGGVANRFRMLAEKDGGVLSSPEELCVVPVQTLPGVQTRQSSKRIPRSTFTRQPSCVLAWREPSTSDNVGPSGLVILSLAIQYPQQYLGINELAPLAPLNLELATHDNSATTTYILMSITELPYSTAIYTESTITFFQPSALSALAIHSSSIGPLLKHKLDLIQ